MVVSQSNRTPFHVTGETSKLVSLASRGSCGAAKAAKSMLGSSHEAARGLESVSATTLLLPLMCCISDVNSAINYK